MKIKKVLGVVALLSSMPFAFNANNLTHVVCAADVQTEDETINLISQDPSDSRYYIPNMNLIKCVDFNEDGTAPTSTRDTFIKIWGGDYIETITPVTVIGGTTVHFYARINPVGASSTGSKTNRTYFNVYRDGKLVGSEAYKSLNSKSGFQVLEFDTTIAETGEYTFRIGSHEESVYDSKKVSNSKYNKFYQTSVTYTTVKKEILPDQRTLSQMAFSYSKDDEGAYSIGDVVLRYGAVLPYVDWSALDINAYGVALTKSSNLEGSLSDLIGSADLSDPSARAGFDKVSFAMGDMDNVARVNADGDLFVEDAEGEFVLFNARLVVPSSNYDTEINAVAFVVVAGKTVLFEEVVRDSVASQARYYLDNGSYSGDVYDVLNILAA